VLAYSTVSQLGFMFMACGVGAFGVAVFHLFTHAFFKALLFLGSGSVIHAMGGEQDMRRMGGLRTKIPWTFWTFVFGWLAIAGIWPFAGFFSKDEILIAAFAAHRPMVFWLGLFAALLTAFYMSRLLFLTFFGKFRGGHDAEHHLHESPFSMLGPLVLLAVGSASVGFLKVPHVVQPVFRLPDHLAPHPQWIPVLATVVALLGIGLAAYMYVVFTDLPARIGAAFGPLHRLFEGKYFFDEAYGWAVDEVVVKGSDAVLWKKVDAGAIDATVNGTGTLVDGLARVLRFAQTGLVRSYAFLILGGAVAVLGYLLWP
jgi:NADH-quinone oxidoreductase subunit L